MVEREVRVETILLKKKGGEKGSRGDRDRVK